MSEKPEEIISDKEIIRVHGYANFGSMTPRDVVNDGVRKYAVGYSGGSTQAAILREHGLITKTRGYQADLTKKGKRYARAIWPSFDECFTRAEVMKLPEVVALVEAVRPFAAAVFNDNGDVTITTDHIQTRHWLRLCTALAAMKGGRQS